jgi:hypothetical protein
MKKSIFVLLALLCGSTAAHACPNLVGTYVCASDSNNPERVIVISQTLLNDAWTYRIHAHDANGVIMGSGADIADGIPRRVFDPYTLQPMHQLIACEQDSGIRMESSSVEGDGQEISYVVHFDIDGSGRLSYIADARIAKSRTVHAESSCNRQ